MTAAAPLQLRIFVSSPGDVAEERRRAAAVIERLPATLVATGRLEVERVLWDDDEAAAPLEAGRSPQDSVEFYKRTAAECDVTIVILATRLGSPAVRDGGKRIRSGTLAEYEAAVAADRLVLVYRSRQGLTIPRGGRRPDQNAALQQFRDVETFFRTRFANAKGELTGGFKEYDDPDDFEKLLEQHLQEVIKRRLEEHEKPYRVPEFDAEHFFVGRDAELDRLRGLVRAGRHAFIDGPPGVGKSALAYDLVRNRAGILRFFAGVLWLAVGDRVQMQRQLEGWADALGITETQRQSLSSAEDWKRAIAAAIGTKRMLIVLDDVWETDHAIDVMLQVPNSVFVVTTRRGDVANSMDNAGGQQVVELGDLKPPAALALLEHYAPHAVRLMPKRAEDLVAAFGGLPLALELMGKYLQGKSGGGNRPMIERAYSKLERFDSIQLDLRRDPLRSAEGGRTGTLRQIIALSWSALETDELREAFAELAVLRPKPYAFTAAEAAAIWYIDSTEDSEAAMDRLGTLVGAGLVGTGPEDFTIHPILHQFAHMQLSADRMAVLELRMLAWHGREVNRMIEDHGPDLYAKWYRVENVKWQYAKDNWLFYLEKSGDERASMLAFLRVYFDAFWWWGFFEAFEFCDRLVEDWRRRVKESKQPSEELERLRRRQREGLDLVRSFAKLYPKGMGRRGTAAEWQACEKPLLEIRRRIGLDTAEGDDATQVRALTDFLLAECDAYGHADFDAAVRRLDGARIAFVGRDDWSASYLACYLAQFELEASRPQRVQAHLEAGFVEEAASRDPEVLSFRERVQGDAALALGNLEAALRSYRRAVAYALVFQAKPEPADAYTVKFFEDTADRLCRSILGLGATDLGRAVELADGLNTWCQIWWQRHPAPSGRNYRAAIVEGGEDAVTRLRAALFPPMPPAGSTPDRLTMSSKVAALLDELYGKSGIPPLH